MILQASQLNLLLELDAIAAIVTEESYFYFTPSQSLAVQDNNTDYVSIFHVPPENKINISSTPQANIF